MYSSYLSSHVLFEPLKSDVNQLYVLSGYATPNMVSWFMKNVPAHTRKSIEISLIVGMVPYDGLSVAVHEGFKELTAKASPNQIKNFTCSYVYKKPSVHSKLYVWAKDGVPSSAFMGSANFTQSAFSRSRREIMLECDPTEALQYYRAVENDTIFCNHAEVEEHVVLRPTHPILDMENRPVESLAGTGIANVTLSLLARDGETGTKSGINWGQRNARNPNEAYIGLPAHIARSGFFPLNQQHFSVITDDGHQLILRVEQQNDKAITTPLSNAQLGEYLRNRIGAANGAYVRRSDLERYGRTNITFYKLDAEQYYMDFSVHA